MNPDAEMLTRYIEQQTTDQFHQGYNVTPVRPTWGRVWPATDPRHVTLIKAAALVSGWLHILYIFVIVPLTT